MNHDHDHHEHDHQDHHGHEHGGHSHGVGHVHAPADFGRAFAVGIALNAGFVVLEAAFGVAGHSVALLADAGHNLSDVLGLLVGWIASILVKRAPTARFTYGLASSSILAALFNAVFLLVVIGGLSWEAIGRLFNPEPVAGGTVMAVAAIGIVINAISAWLFASGRKDDINIRGAFTHMAADALVSLGVVVAGLVILLTGWLWLDPVVSLVINAVIVFGTWSLLRDSAAMSLNAVPPGIDVAKVSAFLAGRPGVSTIHDLHIWGMSTSETALTVHLVMPEGNPGDAFLLELCEALRTRYRIGHATFQVETNPDNRCALAPADVI
jgi:cobalt-zinc-cadmium efflux system protein